MVEKAMPLGAGASMLIGHPKRRGDRLGDAWRARRGPRPRHCGVVEDGEQRVADGVAAIVELHEDVADTAPIVAVLIAGDLGADAPGERHEVIGYRGRS